jgi:UDP-glucose:glycoprotein glucosyltransferase
MKFLNIFNIFNIFISSLIVINVTCEEIKKNSPPVKISLQTPWDNTPLILEAIEFISKEKPDVYFPLLSKISKEKDFPKTTYGQYQYIMKFPEVSELDIEALLKLSLSLRSEAPLIQSYYHYYNASVVPSHQINSNFDTKCQNWLDWYGTQFCDMENFKKSAQISLVEGKYSMNKSDKQAPIPLPIDHIKKSDVENGVVIFYGDVFSKDFNSFLNELLKINEEVGLTFIFRYKKSLDEEFNNKPITISGYGVEMAIKNTEYKVIDDRKLKKDEKENIQKSQKKIPNIPSKEFGLDKLSEKFPKQKDDFSAFNDLLQQQEIPVLKKLLANETEDIGTKIIQYITTSSNPLYVLSQLSSNYPKISHIINQMPLIEEYSKEVKFLQRLFYAPDFNSVFINGIEINAKDLNPFNVLRIFSSENRAITKLNSLRFSNKDAVNLLNSATDDSDNGKNSDTEYYDVRNDIVSWWNNLESDSRYNKWPKNIKEILQPLYYQGQMHRIAKNIYNSLFVVDLTKKNVLEALSEIFIFVERGVPIRFGVVPVVDTENKTELSTSVGVIFKVFIKEYSKKNAKNFIVKLFEASAKGEITKEKLTKITEDILSDNKLKILDDDVLLSTYDDILEYGIKKYYNSLKEFNEKFAITSDSQALFVNGAYSEFSKDWKQSMMTSIVSEMDNIQRKVYYGEITNKDNVYDKILDSPNVRKRKNIYIYPSDENPIKFIDILSIKNLDDMKYFSNAGKLGSHDSIWVISDLSTHNGIKLALEGLRFIDGKSSQNSRLSIVDSADNDKKNAIVLRNIINQVAMVTVPKDTDYTVSGYLVELLEARLAMDEDANEELILKKAYEINEKYGNLMIQKDVDYINQKPAVDFKQIVELTINNKKNTQAIVINGRLIGPWDENVSFTQEDIKLASDFEYEHRIRMLIGKVRAYGKAQEWGDIPIREWYSNLIMKTSYIVSSCDTAEKVKTEFNDSTKERTGTGYIKKFKSSLTTFKYGDIENAKYQFTAIIDPTSKTGQKISSFLMIISKMKDVYIEVQLYSPKPNEDVPELDRFYRYVFDIDMTFDEDKNEILPMAEFENIPIDPLFTVGIHAPQAWLVTPVVSIYDLDNICLKSVEDSGVNAIFELKNILIEGHARDMRLNTPPRGVQLILGTKSYPSMVDTIVMANLGYFQLKANPGVWELQLRSGRSSELYQIINVGNNIHSWLEDRNEDLVKIYEENGITIALTSFEGSTVFLRADKKKGMEKEDVLSEEGDVTKKDKEDDKIWGKLKKKLGMGNSSSTNSSETKKSADKINIFSVASGHLYERLLSVMTLGVMKHTQTPVKFWFIENFLSPSFKKFIPHLAKEYGFEYELVTYKWPHWLRAQSEKQRTIWGYKILFLDVLFPLDLEKVIFVDADQIVRADLKELVEMDLHGAPYGYTPFCNSRKETEGFRFWKTGYWEKHLHGKPYHISALYVIDLVKFRQMAAGDRLRGEYQMLSADKNSLANLDQDLPNNMQDTIPIFSLPQEWLWCETWCDDESLKTAKTIDLCNNPLTKEPKLDRARRLLPEWSVYDNEVAEFEKKVEAMLNGEQINDNVTSKQETVAQSKPESDDKTKEKDEL